MLPTASHIYYREHILHVCIENTFYICPQLPEAAGGFLREDNLHVSRGKEREDNLHVPRGKELLKRLMTRSGRSHVENTYTIENTFYMCSQKPDDKEWQEPCGEHII